MGCSWALTVENWCQPLMELSISSAGEGDCMQCSDPAEIAFFSMELQFLTETEFSCSLTTALGWAFFFTIINNMEVFF